jgi:hypothetical protein
MSNGLKLARFGGLLPRVPDTLLPPTAATVAHNCDFAYGELRSAAASLPERTLAANAASIYTDDGSTFYSWPVDVDAVRSPMANDLFNSLYYTTPTDFRFAARDGMTATGGEPPASYRVGVPRPEAAPSVAAGAGTQVVATNAGMLPVYAWGNDHSSHAYDPGDGPGPTIASVTMTLPTAGSVAAVVTYQSGSPYQTDVPNEDHDVRVEVAADGVVFLAQSTSGIVFLEESRTASAYTSLAAGEHAFTLRFSNDGPKGRWFLDQWSLMLLPVQVSGETLPEDDTTPADVTRAYVWTMVNTHNEEGPPSPPVVFTFPLGTIDVGIDYAPPAGDYAPIKELRIYRTPDNSSTAEYFYVGKVDVLGAGAGSVTFHDDVAAAELNEALASMNYYPPEPDLVGLTQLPNGILMAWKGNELHFSDAYKPWSWPPQYRITFGDYNVVGAIAVGGSTLVTTTGKPFVVAGVSPDSMTYSVLNTQQAGASKWALADLGGQIVYASHDGIVAFDGGLPTMALSDNYFTRDVWRARYASGLATMRFAVWDGRLIVYSSANAFTPFMLGLDEARGALTELPGLVAQCSFVSPVADQCFTVNGASLLRVAGGPLLNTTWTSKTFVLPRPGNYSVAQAVCSGSWTVDFYADGELRHSQAGLAGNVTFRLPGGFLSDRWQIAITGSGTFSELRVAETATELKAM